MSALLDAHLDPQRLADCNAWDRRAQQALRDRRAPAAPWPLEAGLQPGRGTTSDLLDAFAWTEDARLPNAGDITVQQRMAPTWPQPREVRP